MTVKELIALLAQLPPDAEVWMEGDAGLGLVGGVEVSPSSEVPNTEVVIYPAP